MPAGPIWSVICCYHCATPPPKKRRRRKEIRKLMNIVRPLHIHFFLIWDVTIAHVNTETDIHRCRHNLTPNFTRKTKTTIVYVFSDDNTRVLLTTLNDDYINASWVNVSKFWLAVFLRCHFLHSIMFKKTVKLILSCGLVNRLITKGVVSVLLY